MPFFTQKTAAAFAAFSTTLFKASAQLLDGNNTNGTTTTPIPTHKDGPSKLDRDFIAIGLALAGTLVFILGCACYCKCCAGKGEYSPIEGGGSEGCKEAFCCS